MHRRPSLAFLLLPALGLCAAVVCGLDSQAAPPAKADRGKIKQAIKRNGKLPRASYWSHAEVLHRGKKRTIAATPLKGKAGKGGKRTTGSTPAKAKPGTRSALAGAGTRSTLTTVGGEGLPPGFGKGFTWDRVDNEVLLVMFINAADPLGISIEGVRAGDQVQILAASGVASFSEDKGNPLASSIVGLVAAGAKVGAGTAGVPEAVPAIDAAETFAKEQFKATNAKTKRRDAFGVDPGSGHKARQEGGLLVCLPEAGGTYYSGDGSHKGRWIKGDSVRTDDHLPPHVYGSFFPRQAEPVHNTRTARQSGPVFVTAWDWKFEDNAGYYKVFVKLTKGNGPSDGPIFRKKGSTSKAKAKRR
jgi:hypothetical protein